MHAQCRLVLQLPLAGWNRSHGTLLLALALKLHSASVSAQEGAGAARPKRKRPPPSEGSRDDPALDADDPVAKR